MEICDQFSFFGRSPRHLFDNFTGYEYIMLHEASKVMNFTYEMTNPADLQWGVVENGSWNGMVGDVTSGKADLGLGALVTFARLEVCGNIVYIE
jgi:hypothetical protein